MATLMLVHIANALTNLGRLLIRLACWIDDVDFDELDQAAGGGEGAVR